MQQVNSRKCIDIENKSSFSLSNILCFSQMASNGDLFSQRILFLDDNKYYIDKEDIELLNAKHRNTSPNDLVNDFQQIDSNNNLIQEYLRNHSMRFFIEFSAGALGGAVSRTVTAPIDRLKTMFQVHSVDMSRSELSFVNMCKFMYKEGRLRGMWRGNLVNVIKTAPENAIRLATYEKLKQLLHDRKEKTFQEKLACGSAAGLISTLILYPLKTVKTIMNLAKTGEFKSIADCIHKIYEKHGMSAFYRGLMANSVAIIPSTGIDLAIYETMKKSYANKANKSEPNFMEKILIGCLSSTIGNFFVYPLIFARTRLQSNINPNETTLNLLIKVLKRDGFAGIYRGFMLHILKIGPAAGISYFTFESVTKTFSLDSLN